MGLSNHITYRIDPSNMYENESDKLTFQTVTMIFSNVPNLELLEGVNNLNYCLKHGSIGICGRYYYRTIRQITGYNLHNDLRAYQIQEIYEKLQNYIENNEECLDIMETLLKDYDHFEAIEQYFNSIMGDDINFIPPNHIKIICQLFKVMSENNLCLAASY